MYKAAVQPEPGANEYVTVNLQAAIQDVIGCVGRILAFVDADVTVVDWVEFLANEISYVLSRSCECS